MPVGQTSVPDGEAKLALRAGVPPLSSPRRLSKDQVVSLCESLSGVTFADLCEQTHYANPLLGQAEIMEAVETRVQKLFRERSRSVAESFTAWIGASQATALEEVQRALRRSQPDIDDKQIGVTAPRIVANATRKAAHFWETFISDPKLVDMIRDCDQSESARSLIAHYTRREIEHTSISVDQRRERTVKRALYEEAASGNAIALCAQVGEETVLPNQLAIRHLRAYVQSQSDPDSEVHGRIVEAIRSSLSRSLIAHEAIVKRGVPDELFGGAMCLGEMETPKPAAFIGYLRHWRELADERTPGPAELATAVAMRYAKREQSAIETTLATLPADNALTGNVDPLQSELLRTVLSVADTEWFRRVSDECHAKKRRAADGAPPRKRARIDGAQMALRAARSLPELDVAYLRNYWRAPVDNERPCYNGGNCFCTVVSTRYPAVAGKRRSRPGFVCREMLLPLEQATFLDTGRHPAGHHFCFFCELYIVACSQQEYVRRAERPVSILNRFTVKTGVGGFDPRCMLPEKINNQFSGVAGSVLRVQAHDFEFAQATCGTQTVPCLRAKSQLDFRPRSAK